ncbi:MAG: cysteine--tRNA ligase [Gammaproteobacteria bacterium]|jgi:cysteinyl-tRNA synthetase|nr:cysteine--tRNA ligase [Gammaproteobacteria bacterium]MBP6051033.1 cysteine--tRNA ligase [Pseudomonadales bacterium]MBK6582540.1 cysteine--tRNA ligase [Gammaproteobacteria bacterium]MBK7521193.1 cysteine--tRNA ligase [Gammaproteobacteria bacterium]MBK7728967.1 cysteine--tRNA ligase [Gammaproteobacteria bacterium]
MGLRIYNTLSRRIEDFRPLVPGRIGMYVCGITVYDYCHLGHARLLVGFDVIARYLRFRGWQLDYVRNITDIDDKILRRASENGEAFDVLSARFIEAMHEDERALGNIPPDREPRATAHIGEIIAITARLVERGFAYRAANGDVYYRVMRFPGYGKLSGKVPDELIAGARVEIGEDKEDPRDFVLWKAARAGEASWPSPWGAGRPGWHIECSAMAMNCLGETLDIHGGGPDLVFPHHENEIAQSEAATGKCFANYWMHVGALRIDNEKMSKSLGNFFTIREVLARFRPEVVRYLLIASHYRSPINYSQQSLQGAQAALERFYAALRDFGDVEPSDRSTLESSDYAARFCAAMDEDFNTPEALAVMYELVRELNSAARDGLARARSLAADLKGFGAVFGILAEDPRLFRRGGGADTEDDAIDELVQQRNTAKKAGDFARADAIRAQLGERGIVIEDTREGSVWRRG